MFNRIKEGFGYDSHGKLVDMGKQIEKSGFVKQASILALGGIICRIIGILYKRPLSLLIGKEGIGYFTLANNVYLMILLVASYSIPSALSKEIAKSLAKKEYINVQRIFYCAIFYVVIVGGGASLFAYFGATFLAEQNSVLVLKVFAPTIFLSGLVGVLRGYFQGHGSLTQTSVSQIFEQILNAVISIGAAYFLMQAVAKDTTTQAIFGATGSAIGTGAGVLGAFIFMLWRYFLNRKERAQKRMLSTEEKVESYTTIFKNIFFTITPFILCTAIYNLNTIINQTLYIKILMYKNGLMEETVSAMYGIFAGQAVVIANIPIALASAMSVALIPRIASNYSLGKTKDCNQQIDVAIRVTMLIAIPSAVGIAVLALPIVSILFPLKDTMTQAAQLLFNLSISIVFYSLSTLTNTVLQGIGKINIPVINAVFALIMQTIVLVILLITFGGNLNVLVLASIVNAFLICLLNQIAIKRILSYHIKWKENFIIPIVCASIMGGMTKLIYYVLYLVSASNLFSIIVTIPLAVAIYFIFIIKFGAIGEKELLSFPKGDVVIMIASKLNLL